MDWLYSAIWSRFVVIRYTHGVRATNKRATYGISRRCPKARMQRSSAACFSFHPRRFLGTPVRRSRSAARSAVDPAACTLEALRLDPATKTWMEVGSYDGTAVAKIAPFDAIAIKIERLFPPEKGRTSPDQ